MSYGVVSKPFLMALAIMLALAMLAPAQTITTGDVTGTITDSSGAIVQNATVDLKNVNTGASRTVQSNNVGVYRFTLLAPGNYQISASSAGLKSDLGRIVVAVGQIQSVDLVLKPEAAKEVIMVTDAVPLLQTENASMAATYSAKQVDLLPMPGGDITTLAFTVPGITVSTGGGYGNFSSHGLPGISNLFTLNGMDNMDPYLNLNNTGATNLTLGGNEIQETSVIQNAYEGQYGRMAGAQMNFISKSGTNEFHGSLLYNYNGNILNANDFFNNAVGTQRPRAVSNQYGVAGGGRVIRDKVFFFSDYEGFRYTLPFSGFATVPSQALQSYVLNSIPAGSKSLYQQAFNVYNNAPGRANAVKVVNGGGLLQDGLGFLGCGRYLGDGTVAAPGGGIFGTNVSCADAWGLNTSQQNTEWLYTIRGDVNISDKQKMFARFKTDHGLQATGPSLINPLFSSESVQPAYEGQINHTYVISPRTVNNFVGGASWYSAIFGPKDVPAATALMPARISFSSGSGSNAAGISAVGMNFASYPQGRRVGQGQIVDDLTYTSGKHSIKAGINYRYNRVTDTGNQRYLSGGVFSIRRLTEFAAGAIDPATGSTFTARTTSFPVVHLHLYNAGVYVQDQYAATPSLKLTFAIRFDRTSNPKCLEDCFAFLRLPFAQLAKDRTGTNIPYNQSIITGNEKAFYKTERLVPQPRFGFAYNPKAMKSTVIRGGIGLFSDQPPATMSSWVFGNSPNVYTPAVRNGTIALTGTGSAGLIAQLAGQTFQSQFASGATLSTIQTTLQPLVGTSTAAAAFTPPGYYSLPDELRSPKYVEWNLEVEQQIGAKNVLTVNYVGNHGYDIFMRNQFANAYANNGFGRLPATAADARFRVVTQITNAGYSNYNGVAVSFRRALSYGFTGQVGYTFSHAKDTISNGGTGEPFGFDALGNSFTLMTNPIVSRDYSNSEYDVRHSFVADLAWDIPTKFQNKVMDKTLAGWSMGSKVYLRTGSPFSAYDSALASSFGTNVSGILLASVLTPVDSSCGRSAVDTPCLSATQFSSSQTDFGNMPRNSFYGPSYFNIDLSLYKKIPVREKMNFAIGATMYNLLNHANFANPVADVQDGAFGFITGTVIPPSSPYGSFQGPTVSGRVIVLTGKFVF